MVIEIPLPYNPQWQLMLTNRMPKRKSRNRTPWNTNKWHQITSSLVHTIQCYIVQLENRESTLMYQSKDMTFGGIIQWFDHRLWSMTTFNFSVNEWRFLMLETHLIWEKLKYMYCICEKISWKQPLDNARLRGTDNIKMSIIKINL